MVFLGVNSHVDIAIGFGPKILTVIFVSGKRRKIIWRTIVMNRYVWHWELVFVNYWTNTLISWNCFCFVGFWFKWTNFVHIVLTWGWTTFAFEFLFVYLIKNLLIKLLRWQPKRSFLLFIGICKVFLSCKRTSFSVQ